MGKCAFGGDIIKMSFVSTACAVKRVAKSFLTVQQHSIFERCIHAPLFRNK
jgi:hypothetical protein